MTELTQERQDLLAYLQKNYPDDQNDNLAHWAMASLEKLDVLAGNQSARIEQLEKQFRMFKAEVRKLALQALLNERSSDELCASTFQIQALLSLTERGA